MRLKKCLLNFKSLENSNLKRDKSFQKENNPILKLFEFLNAKAKRGIENLNVKQRIISNYFVI